MSYIPCSANCTFQSDGLCSLNYATVVGMPGTNACLHYIPRSAALRNAQWHAAPRRYSQPGSDEAPSPLPGDPNAVLE